MALKKRITEYIKNKLLKPLLGKMDSWERIVQHYPGAVSGGERSAERFNIPKEALQRETDGLPLPGFPGSFPQMFGSITNIRKSIYDLEENPANGKKQMPLELLDELKAFAKEAGADEIGFCEVPQEWVFSSTAIAYTQAIVLVMEMDHARMETAPSQDTAVMVHETYNQLGQTSNKIAGWLRDKGFAAHAGHPLGGLALYPPMGQAAGLGWRGISGLLITPQFGPRVRLAAVFTEIENLPVYEGDEHAWVLDFCEACRICIRDCPPDAFYEKPLEHQNGLITVLEKEKCFPYFVDNHGCSICIKVCPFNSTDYEKVKSGFKM